MKQTIDHVALRGAIERASWKLKRGQVRRLRTLARSLWATLGHAERQQYGKDFYHLGIFAELGLAVESRCAHGRPQTYRLA